MDGDVTSALIGFDAEWERVLAGVMLSQSRGEGAYRLDSGEDHGTVQSSLRGVYPYAQNRGEREGLGVGPRGDRVGRPHAAPGRTTEPMPTDITMRMGAVGFKGQVLDGTGPSGLAMNVKSDAMWVGTKSERTSDLIASEGNVTRLRLIVEGERTFEAGNGARFTPSAELGLRHDAGDAETGTGVEMGAGLSYAAGPLTVEGQVRGLIAHEESGYEEWGASGAIRITPSPSGRGLTLSIAPQWGRTGSATEQLWSAPDATALGTDRVFEGDARLALDAGYGIGVGHGVLTPYAGLTLGDAGSRTVRTGARWHMGAHAVLGLEGTRRTSGIRRGRQRADAASGATLLSSTRKRTIIAPHRGQTRSLCMRWNTSEKTRRGHPHERRWVASDSGAWSGRIRPNRERGVPNANTRTVRDAPRRRKRQRHAHESRSAAGATDTVAHPGLPVGERAPRCLDHPRGTATSRARSDVGQHPWARYRSPRDHDRFAPHRHEIHRRTPQRFYGHIGDYQTWIRRTSHQYGNPCG